MKKKIDIYFIAKEAGVSIATISRFFNNSSVVGEVTREKIINVCNKYNYKPSKIASALSTKRTKSIALLIPSIKNPAFNSLVDGVGTIVSKRGYSLTLFNTKESIEKELEILDIINNRSIDGAIVSGVYGREEDRLFISEVEKRKIPCILVDRYIPDTDIPYVASNDYLGGKIAARFILENNHKNIGIISYETRVHIFKERVRGFTDVLKKEGIKEKYVIEVPRQIGKIEENLIKNRKALLEALLNDQVTIIFNAADFIAIELIKFLSENKIRVTEDVSVMGYDNILFSNFTVPRLSTIDHTMFEMGYTAADNLINKLEKNRFKDRIVIMDPKLVIRNSVRKI